MTFQPPKLEEIEAYIGEKNLTVDPGFFFDYFEAGDWHDSLGKKVKSWKQKILTWHRRNLRHGDVHRCYCGGIGVYIAGKDDTGQVIWRCIDHKPKQKPLPKDLVPDMKQVKSNTVNFNDARNKEIGKLAKRKFEA